MINQKTRSGRSLCHASRCGTTVVALSEIAPVAVAVDRAGTTGARFSCRGVQRGVGVDYGDAVHPPPVDGGIRRVSPCNSCCGAKRRWPPPRTAARSPSSRSSQSTTDALCWWAAWRTGRSPTGRGSPATRSGSTAPARCPRRWCRLGGPAGTPKARHRKHQRLMSLGPVAVGHKCTGAQQPLGSHCTTCCYVRQLL